MSVTLLRDRDTVTIPSPAELVARARDMIPLMRSRAVADEAARKIDPDTIKRMVEAGFFRILQSKRWGGYEYGPEVFADVQIQLAQGDMSIAWVYGVVGVHPYHLCLFDDKAAEDVWGQDSSLLISSPYMPSSTVKSVPGGFEFSGRWSYSTGCDHCPWTVLGGFVDDNPADFRSFLLPRSDARILDTWDTLGLAATGSHDVVVEKAFVPEHRTHKFIDGFNLQNPGQAYNDAIIFRMPFMQAFCRAITNGQIGALQSLLDLTIEYATPKVVMGRPMIDDPDLRIAIAEARAGIFEMTSTIHATFASLSEYAERREAPPMELRLMYKYQSAEVAGRCLRLADALVRCTGSGLVYKKHGIERIYRNMLTGRQHATAQFGAYGRDLGAHMMGRLSQDILC